MKWVVETLSTSRRESDVSPRSTPNADETSKVFQTPLPLPLFLVLVALCRRFSSLVVVTWPVS